MRSIFAAAAVWFCATMASALPVTLTFDGHTSGQGFNYGNSSAYARAGVVYLHDDGGLTSSNIVAQNGRAFSAQSVDVTAFSRILRQLGNGRNRSYNEHVFGFFGYRNGQLKGTQKFGATNASQTVHFGAGFANIDQLVVMTLLPKGVQSYSAYASLIQPGLHCEEWCTDLMVDNLVVAFVPVPASWLMLLSATLGLGTVTVLRRRGSV